MHEWEMQTAKEKAVSNYSTGIPALPKSIGDEIALIGATRCASKGEPKLPAKGI